MPSRSWSTQTTSGGSTSEQPQTPVLGWLRLALATPARAWRPKSRRTCSSRSLRPSARGWDWDYPSAGLLLRRTVARSGLKIDQVVERYSDSRCEVRKSRRRSMATDHVVHVIDDDVEVRQSLAFLLSTAGLAVRVHESAVAFLKVLPNVTDGCVVTDIRMPGMNGLELQQHLREHRSRLP